jgi:hypothetical protein
VWEIFRFSILSLRPTDAVILNLKDQGTFAFIDSDTKSALILFFV